MTGVEPFLPRIAIGTGLGTGALFCLGGLAYVQYTRGGCFRPARSSGGARAAGGPLGTRTSTRGDASVEEGRDSRDGTSLRALSEAGASVAQFQEQHLGQARRA